MIGVAAYHSLSFQPSTKPMPKHHRADKVRGITVGEIGLVQRLAEEILLTCLTPCLTAERGCEISAQVQSARARLPFRLRYSVALPPSGRTATCSVPSSRVRACSLLVMKGTLSRTIERRSLLRCSVRRPD
jgi:hypothetical protein